VALFRFSESSFCCGSIAAWLSRRSGQQADPARLRPIPVDLTKDPALHAWQGATGRAEQRDRRTRSGLSTL